MRRRKKTKKREEETFGFGQVCRGSDGKTS